MKVVGLLSAHLEGVKETTELGYETNQIRIELKKLDAELVLIDPSKLNYGIASNTAYAGFLGLDGSSHDISELDALFIRRTRGYEEKILDFVEFAARANPPMAIVDPVDSFGRPTSKVESILRRVGKFKQPDTSIITAAELLAGEIKLPVVAKPSHGASGKDVKTCTSADELAAYLRGRDTSSAYAGYGTLVQEALVIDAEYRVMVVGGVALGCAKKIGGGNAAQGADFIEFDVIGAKEIMEYAVRVSNFLGQDISGVDIIQSNGELYIIECNRNPQFAAFDRATNANVANEIAKHIMRSIKNVAPNAPAEEIDIQRVSGKPRIFIGSSSEYVTVAEEVQYQLQRDANAVLWTQGVFSMGESAFTSLEKALDKYDYAVFCLTSDDITQSRGNFIESPRDNVVFEAGLFMGRLGVSRVILLVDRKNWPKIPSDLSGLTLLTWESDEEEDMRPRIAPAILDLKRHIGAS